MHQPTIISWGELLWDTFEDGKRLGGSAANVAYHLAQLGNAAILISRVGLDDLGQRACAALAAAGVRVEHVQRDADHPTGKVEVELVNGEPVYRIVSAVAWDYIEANAALEPVLKQASVFCYSTLAQRTSFDSLSWALSQLPPSTMRLCDLNLRRPFVAPARLEAALDKANVVKLNEAELAYVSEAFGVKDAPAWLIREREIDLVAVTLGRAGCRLIAADANVYEPGVPAASGGDPVGAGDAFVAVIAHGLARQSQLPSIAQGANRYAAHIASCRGGMPAIPPALRTSVTRTLLPGQ